jgi:hypothetical protein
MLLLSIRQARMLWSYLHPNLLQRYPCHHPSLAIWPQTMDLWHPSQLLKSVLKNKRWDPYPSSRFLLQHP